jgi:hypothetical protein
MSFQVAKIETEKMLITMVETELEKRKAEGRYLQRTVSLLWVSNE